MTIGQEPRPQIGFATGVNLDEAQRPVSSAEAAALSRDELISRLVDTSSRITWQLPFLLGELEHYRKTRGSDYVRPAERHVAGLVEDAIAGLERLSAALKGAKGEGPTCQ